MTYLADVSTTVRFVEYPWIMTRLDRLCATILDIGCWDSLFPIMLASVGHSVTGVDIRDYPYTHKNFTFIQGDIMDIGTFRAGESNIINQLGRFDAVTLVSVLEHVGLGNRMVWDADESLMKLISRNLLAEHGRVFVTVPCGLPKLIAREPGGQPWFRTYNRSTLNALAYWADMEIVDCEYFAQNGTTFERIPEELGNKLQNPDVAMVARGVVCVEFA